MVFLNRLLSKERQKVYSQTNGVLRITKEAQIMPGEKLMPNSPAPWDFKMSTLSESAKVFGGWLSEMGK